MSIQSEINRINGNIASAYSALSAKGATMPSVQNTANLASTIESIEMITAEAMSIETIRAICYTPTDWEKNYTQVQYIQSSGTQYIDTGVLINSATYKRYQFVLDMQYVRVSDTYWLVNGASGSGVIYYFGISNNGNITYGNGTSDNYTPAYATAGRYVIDFNPYAKYYKFGELQTLTGLAFNPPSGSQRFFLFAYNKGGGQDCHTERIYSCKIYDNGTLIRDFVPCKHKTSGAVGLYDMVNEKFYGNAGAGVLTAGPDIA